MLWIQILKKMTRQIRKTAAKNALKKLQEASLRWEGEMYYNVNHGHLKHPIFSSTLKNYIITTTYHKTYEPGMELIAFFLQF